MLNSTVTYLKEWISPSGNRRNPDQMEENSTAAAIPAGGDSASGGEVSNGRQGTNTANNTNNDDVDLEGNKKPASIEHNTTNDGGEADETMDARILDTDMENLVLDDGTQQPAVRGSNHALQKKLGMECNAITIHYERIWKDIYKELNRQNR